MAKSINPIPVVPAVLFKAATTVLDRLGFSSERIVEKAGVPLWQYCESHTLIPGNHFYRLVGQAAVILGTDEFGYLIPRYTPVTAIDDFGTKIAGSLTVYDAIKRFNTLYGQMSSIDRFWSVEDGEGLWWLRKRVQAADHAGRQQVEMGALHYMIQTVRLGIGSDWAPVKIWLEGESQFAMDRLEDFGSAAIHEQQGVSGLLIPRSVLARSVPTERSSTVPLNTSTLFAEVPPGEFHESLRRIVRSYLSFGHPGIEEVADAVGIGVRALQRRLQEHGLTYKQVVDEARFLASAAYLNDPHVSLIEVALKLGYSDQGNFSRAFRRWAGISPGEYRRQLRSSGSR